LHTRTRRRILADRGTPGQALNQRLTAWWDRDFPAFRAEIQKVFRHDIPVKARDEWTNGAQGSAPSINTTRRGLWRWKRI
jgi:hypothetical protein